MAALCRHPPLLVIFLCLSVSCLVRSFRAFVKKGYFFNPGHGRGSANGTADLEAWADQLERHKNSFAARARAGWRRTRRRGGGGARTGADRGDAAPASAGAVAVREIFPGWFWGTRFGVQQHAKSKIEGALAQLRPGLFRPPSPPRSPGRPLI